MANFEVTNPSAVRDGEEIVVTAKAQAGFVRLRMSATDALELMQAISRSLVIGKPPEKRK